MSKKHSTHTSSSVPFWGKTRGEQIRKLVADILLGLFIVGIGVGYLGNDLSFLPWTNFTIFFPAWGALFLIVPGIYWLIRKPFSWFWPICLLIGVLILLSKQEQYSFGVAAAIVLASFVILVGLRMIFAPIFKRMRKKRMQKEWQKMVGTHEQVIFIDATGGATSDGIYNVSFGNRRVTIDEDFTSASISVSFGEMNFDLRDAAITDCAVIEANCSFGETHIHLPADVQVELSPRAVFGDIRNRHPLPADPDAPIVYITASVSFGEIHID